MDRDDLKRDRFWMVWRERGGHPTHKHMTKRLALVEAERLAKLHPSETFYVLKSTAGVVASAPTAHRVHLTDCEIPF